MPPLPDAEKLEPDEGKTILGPKSLVQVGSVGAIALIIWWAATLTADVATIKQSIVRLNALEVLSSRVEQIDSFGSKATREISSKLQSLDQAMTAYREKGSPVNVEHERQIEDRLSKLESKVSVHEALDDKRMGTIK